MRNIDFKKILEHKLKGFNVFPSDEILSSLTHEAMLWVANKCVPSELLRNIENDEQVYRHIQDDCFICMPDVPDFTDENSHIMIDEALTYAVMNEVAFMHTHELGYRNLALEIIADYIANYKKGRI